MMNQKSWGGRQGCAYPVALVMLSLVFQCLALTFGKVAAMRLHAFSVHGILLNGYYLASLACLGLQAICWPLALRRLPLFWAYLLMSGLYIAIPLISHFVFHETVTRANIAGALIIMAGIVVMSVDGGARQDV